MPSIIPSPGGAPPAPNLTSGIALSGPYQVGASETLSLANAQWLFLGQTSADSLVNEGALWLTSTQSFATALSAQSFGSFDNRGLIVVETSTNGGAYGLSLGLAGSIANSGRIFALATGNSASGILSYSPGEAVANQGLIAVRSDNSIATGVSLVNGGQVVNAAGAEILAEGVVAHALVITPWGYEPGQPSVLVDNHGRIEAASLDPQEASIAITVNSFGAHEIVNGGVIRGDYAILSNSYAFSPHQKAADTVTNQSGGLIEGIVDLALGDDVVANQGTISGEVRMGDGNDLVDTSAGRIQGSVLLGWGDDRFVGGVGDDTVAGDRGNDSLDGGDGQDLLVGGRGDDLLVGGRGNDGLYGDFGDDRIVVSGGDRAWGGAGDDRLVLEDLAFAEVDGGDGFDRLQLDIGARALDLSAALADGRLHGIDEIDLDAGQRLVVRSGDIAALSGSDTLTLGTLASDTIELVGPWGDAGSTIVDGRAYRHFTQGGTNLLVAGEGQVAIVASPSAPAGGLDPIASGPAAPIAGAAAGTELAAHQTVTDGFELESSLTIETDETWQSASGLQVIYSERTDNEIVNLGKIINPGGDVHGPIIGIDAWQVDWITNQGLISATGAGANDARGVYSGEWGKLDNQGRIEAIAGSAFAQGAFLAGALPDRPILINSGEIYARTDGTWSARGVYLYNGGIASSSGSIEAIGGDATTGLWSDGELDFDNGGTITASLAAGATGTTFGAHLVAYAHQHARIVNSGTIEGDFAVFVRPSGGLVSVSNFGTLAGEVSLGDGNDRIDNQGLIDGGVSLGAGDDLFRASTGHQTGTVHGDTGNDILVGGIAADLLDGGDGDDLIEGGGGGDRLAGGAGRDTFLYTAASDSSAVAPDTISGFETGIDRIDLLALGASNVSLSADGSATLVTAAAAAGTVEIRVEGTIGQSDIVFAPAQSPVATGGDDLLIAPAGGGGVQGGGGADHLVGLDGDDRLDGGAGADTMWGGKGDDYYVVGAEEGDFVFELLDDGIDTIEVHSDPAVGYGIYALPDNIENLVMVSVNTGLGNKLDNAIFGSAAKDYIDGRAGDDTIVGGLGADTLVGSGGADHFVYRAAAESTAAAMDDLDDFATGVDKIDLTALGAVGIRLSVVHDPVLFATYNVATVATVAGEMAIRIDAPVSLSDFIYTPAFRTISGSTGDDRLDGFDTGSSFLLQQGGSDHAIGRDGADGFYFGAALDPGDSVDGGGGTDTIALQGNTSLALGDIANVEVLALISGADTSFGDTANNRYDYGIATNDANVAAGATLSVIGTGLLPGEDVRFDGSAESNGNFRIFAGQGIDDLKGGAGSDGFFFGAEGNLTAADHVDGGAGVDSLALRGEYDGANAVVFQDGSFVNIEVLALLSSHTNEYSGQIVPTGFDYDVTMADGNVAAGQRLDIAAGLLGADEGVRFDGRAEANGSFRIFSGAADDTLYGGSGNDLLYGGLGADRLEGGGGADSYAYLSAAESTSTHFDTITGFDWHSDRIDIPGSTARSFGQTAQGSLSSATFDTDLAAGLNGHLGAGEAAIFTANGGTLSGHVFAIIDVNGQAGYQAGADLVIELVNAVLPIDTQAALIV